MRYFTASARVAVEMPPPRGMEPDEMTELSVEACNCTFECELNALPWHRAQLLLKKPEPKLAQVSVVQGA